MDPPIAEVVFWSIVGIGCVLFFLVGSVMNPYYDPKEDDPYRFCPK